MSAAEVPVGQRSGAVDAGRIPAPWSEATGTAISEALFETIGALVVIVCCDGRILRFNPTCERLTGFTADEVEGRPFAETLVAPDQAPAVRAHFEGLRPGDPTATHEHDWLTRAGGRLRVLWSSTPVPDGAGRISHVIATGVDVSGRRRAEDALAGIEAVRTVLAALGPTPNALQAIMAVLSQRLGYTHVSIYLAEAGELRMGAQVGYEHPIPTFATERGVLGRVHRTRRPVHLREVTGDPDYVAADPAVRSEIAVPLLSDGELLGVLNVESARTDQPLDERDLALLESVADRLASALALGRERARLAERAELLDRLGRFARTVTGTLEAARLWEQLVDGVGEVLPADVIALCVLDRPTGLYRYRAVRGIEPDAVGAELRPGEGVAGRAIRERGLVVEERLPRAAFPAAVRDRVAVSELSAAGVPLVDEGTVVGALLVGRAGAERRFSEVERDALELLAAQAALAVANAFLHAEVAEAALHDPLTGLHNRRFLDGALRRMVAARQRVTPADRRPVAAIMFDLDHFGRLNEEHGHQAGDQVLRAFGGVLAARFRSGDLVARYGGEEFLAVLEGASLGQAIAAAEEVRASFQALTTAGSEGQPIRATVSAGCAALDREDPSVQGLVRAADAALFLAKRAGRNRVASI